MGRDLSGRSGEEIELERGAVLALLTTGYACLAILSIILFKFQNGGAGVWLPNAFAVVLLLRNASLRPLDAGVAVFAGCMAANLLLDAALGMSILYSLANATLVVVEARLIARGFGQREPAIATVRDYAIALVAGGIAAPAVVSLFFSTFMRFAFGWPILETCVTWVIGEAFGFALLLPVLMLASRETLANAWRRRTMLAVLGAATASVGFAVAASSFMELPFLLTIVPLMVLVAFVGSFEVAVACGLVGAALVGLVIAGVLAGLDASLSGFTNGFQLSVTVVAVLPFVISLIVDEARRDRLRIVESEQRFRRVMEDSAIGVAIVGLNGHITEVNRAFADMLGYARHELEGMTFFQITHPDDLSVGADTMRQVRAGQADSYHFEKRYMRKDGSAVWARLAGSVIRDSRSGAPRYLVSQIENINARKLSEAAIAEAELRWDFALASAGQGVWDVDVRKGRTAYSSTWRQMLGYSEDQLTEDSDHWLTLVHPDDRARVETADTAMISGKAPLFEEEFRMRHKDGRWRWILDRGRVIERDESGSVLRMIGTLTDITTRKEAEERMESYAALLADEKERLRVTLDSIGDAVICTDAAMHVTYMNPVAENLTGVAEGEALGQPLARVYAPADEETGESIAAAAALAGLRQRVEHNSRAMLSKKDGSRCFIREVVSPILNDKGEFGGSVIVFQDFTDARTLQRRLAHAASHDSLTGLANRANLTAAVSNLVAAPRRAGAGDLFLYCDLDNFKMVNDTGGHAAGDDLLKRVAAVIKETVREGDFIARLGGDEFAVVLERCSVKVGKAIAEKLIGAVEALDLGCYSVDGRIGVSIGLTGARRGEAVEAIIARADHACYQAKAAGRGRVASVEVGAEKPRTRAGAPASEDFARAS